MSRAKMYEVMRCDGGRWGNSSWPFHAGSTNLNCCGKRAGLRLLEDQQKQSELQLEAMKAAIAAGLASGRSISGDQVFDRLEAKYHAQAAGAER